MSSTLTPPTVRPKEIDFPVSIEWLGGRRVLACVAGKPEVPVAPPPVFRGTDPELWSPEDLFVAAAASCLAVTFTGLAERANVHLSSLRVDGEGTVGRREDGRFGFIRVDLRLRAVAADTDLAHALALKAEENCLVSASFGLPVHVSVDVRTAAE
jgi:organic hydroperoxide reductase OsmC/OhrA